MFSERQRKRIENMIAWADAREAECLRENRAGAANHHKAKASALRAVLAEIDRLTQLVKSSGVEEGHER